MSSGIIVSDASTFSSTRKAPTFSFDRSSGDVEVRGQHEAAVRGRAPYCGLVMSALPLQHGYLYQVSKPSRHAPQKTSVLNACHVKCVM